MPGTNTGDVSQLYAEALAEYARGLGLARPASPRLCGAGFVSRVDGGDFVRQIQGLVQASGDRDLGLRFGAAIGGRGFGLLGLATAAAPSLRQSLASLARWEPLTSSMGRIGIVRRRNCLRLSWTPQQPVPPALAEGILGGWIAFGRFLVGETVPVLALELGHRRQGLSEAEALLHCAVRANATQYAIVIPADILDARPRYADADLHAAMASWLDVCVALLRGGNRLVLDAGRQILDGLAWHDGGEDALAAQLGLARRTLQRRLAAAGTGFRHLRDLLRASVALSRLSAGGERLQDIAQRSGFAEQASFSRAVRSWTGRSPREVAQRFARGYATLRIP